MSVTLLLGKCEDRFREISDGSVDLILTSPPYGGLRKYASGSGFDFEAVAVECLRTLKPGGVLVWVVADETVNGSESGSSFRQALHFKSIGLRLHDTMIYRKANYLPLTHQRYEQAFEFMFVLSKGKPKTFNPITEPCKRAGKLMLGSTHYRDGESLSSMSGVGRPTKARKISPNIWTYSVAAEPNGHPAIFPLQLAVDHVLSWTNPGDIVVDPFTGSGTTAIACLKTGRRFVGMERAADYLALAERRIAEAALPLLESAS